jgi:hypothetical protein
MLHIVIYWVNGLSGRNGSRIVSMEDDCFFIQDIDTCVQYEESVRAANGKGENGDGVTGKTATETAGNCQRDILLF